MSSKTLKYLTLTIIFCVFSLVLAGIANGMIITGAVVDTSSCDDGNACTINDHIVNGQCVGEQKDCGVDGYCDNGRCFTGGGVVVNCQQDEQCIICGQPGMDDRILAPNYCSGNDNNIHGCCSKPYVQRTAIDCEFEYGQGYECGPCDQATGRVINLEDRGHYCVGMYSNDPYNCCFNPQIQHNIIDCANKYGQDYECVPCSSNNEFESKIRLSTGFYCKANNEELHCCAKPANNENNREIDCANKYGQDYECVPCASNNEFENKISLSSSFYCKANNETLHCCAKPAGSNNNNNERKVRLTFKVFDSGIGGGVRDHPIVGVTIRAYNQEKQGEEAGFCYTNNNGICSISVPIDTSYKVKFTHQNFSLVEKVYPEIIDNRTVSIYMNRKATVRHNFTLYAGWNGISGVTIEPLTFSDVQNGGCSSTSVNSFVKYTPSSGWVYTSSLGPYDVAYLWVDENCSFVKTGHKRLTFAFRQLQAGANMFGVPVNGWKIADMIKDPRTADKDCIIEQDNNGFLIARYNNSTHNYTRVGINEPLLADTLYWIKVKKSCRLTNPAQARQ